MNTDRSESNIPEKKQNLLKNQSKEVKDLLDTYYDKQKYVDEITQYLQEAKHIMNECKKELQYKCKHEWIKNPAEYQTHTSWTCSICDEFTFHK